MDTKTKDLSVETLFTSSQVLKAVNITYRQLSYWELKGLIKPTYQRLGSRDFKRYCQEEINTLKTVKKLLDEGYSLPATDTLKEVTKRKEAEQALRESEERYRALAESSVDAIFIHDREGRYLYANQACTQLFDRKPEEIIGKRLSNFFAKEKAKEVLGAIRGVFSEKKVIHIEYSLSLAGGVRYYFATLSPIHNAQGDVVSVMRASRNITEYKKTEVKLRTSEQRFKDLTETTTDWVWEVNRDGVYTYASPKIKDLLGYEVSEVLGKTPFDLMPAEEAKEIGKFFKEKVIKKEPFYRLENINRHNDGHLVVLETSGIPLFDEKGQLKGYRGIDRDITERKKKEIALQESKERFQLLYERAPVGYQSLNEEGCFIEVNQTWLNMLGYSQEEVIGRWFGDFVTPEYRERFKKNFPHFKAAGEIHDVEFKILRKDATIMNAIFDGTIIYDNQGKFKQTHCSIRDITEGKKTQERQVLRFKILKTFHQQKSLKNLCERVISLIKEYLNCEVVALRLKEGEDYPYFVNNGFPKEFIESENYLCVHDEEGNVLKNHSDNPVLACMCGIIINAKFSKDKPFFTRNGSFWTNNTTNLLASTTVEQRGTTTRNTCNQYGYESVALIPIKSTARNIGLLQINDKKENLFTSSDITFLEEMGHTIGMIIEHKQGGEKIEDLAKFPSENPYPVLRIAKDRTILYANAAAEPLISSENCKIGQVIPERWHQLIDDVFASGLIKDDFEVKYKDRIFLWMMVPITDAGYISIYGMDVTERKKTEKGEGVFKKR